MFKLSQPAIAVLIGLILSLMASSGILGEEKEYLQARRQMVEENL